jgi:hypothetical protein
MARSITTPPISASTASAFDIDELIPMALVFFAVAARPRMAWKQVLVRRLDAQSSALAPVAVVFRRWRRPYRGIASAR